jgi:3-methyladenine DNA glycosylase/8-oxoguanine DNA glycosylase
MKRLDHTAACEHLTRVDRQLARIIAHHGPCRLQPETTQSIFAALLKAIVYQQLTGKVAATILGRVKALFPENTQRIRTRPHPIAPTPGALGTPVRGLVDGFPTPEQILAAPDELLRSAGLSRAKLLAIRDLAAKALDGTVPTVKQAQRMSDEELIERLDTVRGVGRWTVEMLLIFRLGRPDVLPGDDYGVRKGFARMRRLEELPKPKELLAYGERWRPHRSVASWYLWRAAERKTLPMARQTGKKTLSVKSKAGAPPKKSPARQR